MVVGDVPSNGVALVPVDAALALLEVHRVRGQVPVQMRGSTGGSRGPPGPTDVVTSTNGQKGELKAVRTWPGPLDGALLVGGADAEAQGEAAPHPRGLIADRAVGCSDGSQP